MENNYDNVYEEYLTKFKESSLGDELKYNPDIVKTIIDLLKSLKNKLTIDQENIKSEIIARFNSINEVDAIKNTSTYSNFDVMNEKNINASATRSSIESMPENIENLFNELIQIMEDESQIIDDYITRKNTSSKLEEYRKFLTENNEKYRNYKNNSETYNVDEEIDFQNYEKIKKLVQDYDNLTALANLKNSKLLNKAINKKIAFSEAGKTKIKNISKSTSSSSMVNVTSPKIKTFTVDQKKNEKEKITIDSNIKKFNNEKIIDNQLKSETNNNSNVKNITNSANDNNIKNIDRNIDNKTPINNTESDIKNDSINKEKSTLDKKENIKKDANNNYKYLPENISKSEIPKKTITVNDIKDIKGTIEYAIDKAKKVAKDTKGSLTSTIGSLNKEKIKPLLNIANSIETKSPNSNKFIPPIAGISTATVAGLGTKIYIDKEDNKKEKKDKDDNKNKFFYEIKEEKKESLSKEDLIKMLENKF